ncbi:MAG: aspartate carbamoyltransferase regulatory subunit [Infirmifilum sp.]
MEDRLIVRKIKDGTVIDHIPAGRAFDVLKILGIKGKEDVTVALVMNVESKKLGKKDIVKIEKRFLKREEVDKIALVAPTATINIIKDYQVVEKRDVQIPDEIVGLLKCINPLCISNAREPVTPRLKVESKQPLKLRCVYCDEVFGEEALEQLVSK